MFYCWNGKFNQDKVIKWPYGEPRKSDPGVSVTHFPWIGGFIKPKIHQFYEISNININLSKLTMNIFDLECWTAMKWAPGFLRWSTSSDIWLSSASYPSLGRLGRNWFSGAERNISPWIFVMFRNVSPPLYHLQVLTIQLTLVQHRFELCVSTCTWTYFHSKYYSSTQSIVGWIHQWGTVYREG